jgi:hypothetical protein
MYIKIIKMTIHQSLMVGLAGYVKDSHEHYEMV